LFAAFDPADLFDAAMAHRYRDRILAPGGSKDAADLVADFLGRPFSFEAFATWLDARRCRRPANAENRTPRTFCGFPTCGDRRG
jgi:hypothetical protein